MALIMLRCYIGCKYQRCQKGVIKMNDAIKEAYAGLKAANEILQTNRDYWKAEAEKHQWTSVKDRLPEEEGKYIVFKSNFSHLFLAIWTGNGWVTFPNRNDIKRVRYWAPFPKLPKGYYKNALLNGDDET